MSRPLTERMDQVVAGIARGKPSKLIGAEIGISATTVQQYAWRLKQRYGLSSSRHLPGEIEYRSWAA